LKQVLDIKKIVLGEGHPYVALTLDHLAQMYLRKGMASDVEPLYRAALLIVRHAPAYTVVTLATLLHNISLLLIYQEKWELAKTAVNEAIRIFGFYRHPHKKLVEENLAFILSQELQGGRYEGEVIDPETVQQALNPAQKHPPPLLKDSDLLKTCIGVVETSANEVTKKSSQLSNPETSSTLNPPTDFTRTRFFTVAKEFSDSGPQFEFPPLPPQKTLPTEDVAGVSHVLQGPTARGTVKKRYEDFMPWEDPLNIKMGMSAAMDYFHKQGDPHEARCKREAKRRAPYLPRPYHELIKGTLLTPPCSRYLEFISINHGSIPPIHVAPHKAMPPHGPLALTASFNSDSLLGIPSNFIN